jgi:Ca2+-binding RTX toxin-like protein
MKTNLALMLTLGLWAFGAFVLTSEALPANCTEVGTPARDILAGTSGPDRICAQGGDDYVHAAGRRDVVFGMAGRDTLVAGGGRDILKGGGGGDKLFAIDQRAGNDVVYGGPGDDQCFVDRRDRVHGCEHVHRVSTSRAADATIAALERAILGESLLGEEFQEDAAIPGPVGPPGPPGPPGTGGPPFPNCPSPVDASPVACQRGGKT